MSRPSATDPHTCEGLPDGMTESDAVAITYAIVNKYLDKMRDALFSSLGCQIPVSCWLEMSEALNGEVVVMDDIIQELTSPPVPYTNGDWFSIKIGDFEDDGQ